MFGISYNTWKEICDMYFSLHIGIHKAYLQWFPFSKLSDEDKAEISGVMFFEKYIKNGGFVLFPEAMRHSENFIQKSDGSFRNAVLVSPILYLVLQAIGKEISARYTSQRPFDVGVYYAGNYELNRPRYPKCKKPNYKGYYKESAFKSLYAGIADCDTVIEKAHELRNANPLSHSSAGLIESNNSSRDLMDIEKELDRLINQYAVDKHL